MTRRGNAEGSIYQRAGRRGWYAAVSQDGKRKILRGETRREVGDKLRAAQEAKEHGELVMGPSQTVAGYLASWLAEVVKPSVRPRTHDLYSLMVRAHIAPVIGTVRLDRLSAANVRHLLNAATEAGLSPRSVQMVHGTLRNALNQALRWHLVARNVARDVDGPRVESHEIQPLGPTEARALLAAVADDRLQAFYSVALALGLRQGEALGLRWQDVDLEAGVIHVCHQLQRMAGAVVLSPLKTARSRRTIALPASIASDLRDHRQQQRKERLAAGPAWVGLEPLDDGCYVFTTPVGTPLEKRNVVRAFKAVLRRAGLPDCRFHDLRHSTATLLLASGVDVRTIMDLLGHSEIALTLNTYSHVLPELRREAANRMDAILGG
jgi:integrase